MCSGLEAFNLRNQILKDTIENLQREDFHHKECEFFLFIYY